MFEVEISSMSPERFRSVLTAERFEAFAQGVREARELLAGRVVWNINSTARGGGVAELLESLVAYARGAGLDVRWTVIEGTPDFFAVTKRIHNRLHGAIGDGGALDDTARAVYEQVLAENLPALTERVRPGDVAIVHDPQPAGLIAGLRAAGAAVIWRCHVGLDHPNELAREAWDFLSPYVHEADAFVFSRESFAWDCLDPERIVVIAPSIDVFSPKNEDLDRATVLAVLRAAGLLSDGGKEEHSTFTRQDATPYRVDRRAEVIEDEPLDASTPVVLQVSRWDALKDPVGVIRGFAQYVPERTGAHLVYAGPAVTAVADDPEGLKVLQETRAVRESLPAAQRRRIHLASLPMDDPAENAIMVNALQRHVNVIVQKSIAEGFGLTVAEAMWKARPVVASRIGGIQSQIIDGETGILLDDPRDMRAFGEAVTGLLGDSERAELLGRRARERVRDEFTSPRSLLDYLRVIRQILDRSGVRAAV
ncbi:MAG TPA: glycosyltransferase [Gemmatimonadaceae bacterium]|nr:glycosyltransferase [Gemmatimonadaceae bacterium]